jgi:hypothetical protein
MPFDVNLAFIKGLNSRKQNVMINVLMMKKSEIKYSLVKWNITHNHSLLLKYDISSNSFWREFYKRNTSKKYLQLSYFIINSCLNVNGRIYHFVDVTPNCHCGLKETIEHLFLECPSTKEFWNFIENLWRNNGGHTVIPKSTRITGFWNTSFSKNKKMKEKWDKIYGPATYSIWKARNDFIFQNNQVNPQKIINIFNNLYY